MAHFHRASSCNLIGGQQAGCNAGIAGLLHDPCLCGIRQGKFRQGCTTACGVLLGRAWVDQAQEQGPCQSAMLF